jgi:predicted RNA-binding protein Jag
MLALETLLNRNLENPYCEKVRMELDANGHAWKEGETLLSYTPNMGRKLLPNLRSTL